MTLTEILAWTFPSLTHHPSAAAGAGRQSTSWRWCTTLPVTLRCASGRRAITGVAQCLKVCSASASSFTAPTLAASTSASAGGGQSTRSSFPFSRPQLRRAQRARGRTLLTWSCWKGTSTLTPTTGKETGTTRFTLPLRQTQLLLHPPRPRLVASPAPLQLAALLRQVAIVQTRLERLQNPAAVSHSQRGQPWLASSPHPVHPQLHLRASKPAKERPSCLALLPLPL